MVPEKTFREEKGTGSTLYITKGKDKMRNKDKKNATNGNNN